VQLCQIPNIGKVRAKKLWDLGYKNVGDVAKEDVAKLKKLLNMKEDIVKQVVTDASRLASS
jgi:predicted flap endonuclease-1-like 5' DNA nuclease